MPRTAKTGATEPPCEACQTMDVQKVHTCEEAEGQRGILQVKAWPGGKPPLKKKYLKDAMDAQKKQASQRLKAKAKPFAEGTTVKLPSRVKPSSEDQIKDFIFPERRGGPVLAQADRQLLAKILARAYWAGGFPWNMGGAQIVAALLAAKVVVEPWKCDWFQGFVDSDADAKKRFEAGKAEACTERKRESHDCFDEDIFAGMSETHAAHYQRLAKKLAFDVAERDNKERPTCPEIWENPYYWLDVKNRAGDACAGCLRKFGGRYGGLRFLIWLEHRNGGPHDGELSDAPSCKQCNTSSRARADAAAAALHAQDATYTQEDAGDIARGSLALMGRGSDDAAARRLAKVRAATVTRSADDAALAEAQVPTPARDRGDGVERFDPAARDRAPRVIASTKSCPACSAEIARCLKICPKCNKPCTKKRRSS